MACWSLLSQRKSICDLLQGSTFSVSSEQSIFSNIMSTDNPVPYLNIVHRVFPFSFLWHQGLALLPQVWAHTLTHGLQPIGNPAEQLVHACQICREVSMNTHMSTHQKSTSANWKGTEHLRSAEKEEKYTLQALQFQFDWNQIIIEFLTYYYLWHEPVGTWYDCITEPVKYFLEVTASRFIKECWGFSISL